VVAPREIVEMATGITEGQDGEKISILRYAVPGVMASLVSDFRPDIFISTSHRGVGGEMSMVSDLLRKRHSRLVLALRDIYYPPEFVGDFRAMSGAEFDLVMIGGPRAVSKWAPEGLLDGQLAPKVHYAGYLGPVQEQSDEIAKEANEVKENVGPYIVKCQVGGGRDGAPLAKAVIEAVDSIRRSSAGRVELYLATGPLMSRSDIQALESMSSEHTHVRVWSDGNAPHPHLIVSMAGYNSCVEAAWTGLRSILVPRDDPDDLEQGIRAELFSGWFSNIAIAPSDPASIANSISSVLFSGALQRETSAEATSDEVRPDAFFALPRRVALTVLGKR
jgi:predicted glycosyltransferase